MDSNDLKMEFFKVQGDYNVGLSFNILRTVLTMQFYNIKADYDVQEEPHYGYWDTSGTTKELYSVLLEVLYASERNYLTIFYKIQSNYDVRVSV